MQNIIFKVPHHRVIGTTKQALAVRASLKSAFPLHADGIAMAADLSPNGATRVVCTAEEFSAFIIARTKHGAQNMVAELRAQECTYAPPPASEMVHVVTPAAFKNGYDKLVSEAAAKAKLEDIYAKAAEEIGLNEGQHEDRQTRKREELAMGYGMGFDAFKRGYAMYGDMNFWPNNLHYKEVFKMEPRRFGKTAATAFTATMADYLKQHGAMGYRYYVIDVNAPLGLREVTPGVDYPWTEAPPKPAPTEPTMTLDNLQTYVSKLVKSGAVTIAQVKGLSHEFGVGVVRHLRRGDIERYKNNLDAIALQNAEDKKEEARVAYNKQVDEFGRSWLHCHGSPLAGVDPEQKDSFTNRVRNAVIEEIAGDFDRRAERNRQNAAKAIQGPYPDRVVQLKKAQSRNEYNAGLLRSMKDGVSIVEATRQRDATYFRDRYIKNKGQHKRRFLIPVETAFGPVYMTGYFLSSEKIMLDGSIGAKAVYHWLDKRLNWTDARPAPNVRFAPDWNKPDRARPPKYFDPSTWTGRYQK